MISFIVPIFNTKEYLSKCVDSILNSGINDYEIILVDDGSTDGSDLVCKEYQMQYPDQIRFILKKNGGASSARNVGLDAANGEYVMFVDSDDYLFGGACPKTKCDAVSTTRYRGRKFGNYTT